MTSSFEILLLIVFLGLLFWLPVLISNKFPESKNSTLATRLAGGIILILLLFSESNPPIWFIGFVICMLIAALLDHYKSSKNIGNSTWSSSLYPEIQNVHFESQDTPGTSVSGIGFHEGEGSQSWFFGGNRFDESMDQESLTPRIFNVFISVDLRSSYRATSGESSVAIFGIPTARHSLDNSSITAW